MNRYRVFPYDPSAKDAEPGHPLFIPRGGGGRLDNPDHFSVFYCSSDRAGAVAEAFGCFPEWTPRTLVHSSGRQFALATFTSHDERILDLDSAATLLDQHLRPSEVVTRDRQATRAWALRIYSGGLANGVAWWSYYKPEWSSIGFWNSHALSLASVELLTIRHESLVEAATVLPRLIRTN